MIKITKCLNIIYLLQKMKSGLVVDSGSVWIMVNISLIMFNGREGYLESGILELREKYNRYKDKL